MAKFRAAFIAERHTPCTLAARARAGGVPALHHEVGDQAVELDAVIVSPLAEQDEIVTGKRRQGAIQLEVQLALRGHQPDVALRVSPLQLGVPSGSKFGVVQTFKGCGRRKRRCRGCERGRRRPCREVMCRNGRNGRFLGGSRGGNLRRRSLSNIVESLTLRQSFPSELRFRFRRSSSIRRVFRTDDQFGWPRRVLNRDDVALGERLSGDEIGP